MAAICKLLIFFLNKKSFFFLTLYLFLAMKMVCHLTAYQPTLLSIQPSILFYFNISESVVVTEILLQDELHPEIFAHAQPFTETFLFPKQPKLYKIFFYKLYFQIQKIKS